MDESVWVICQDGDITTVWGKITDAVWLKESGYTARDGCDYVEHDCDKASRMMKRLFELGAVHVYASPDLCHMLTGLGHASAASHGFVLICDKTLPPNSLIDATARRLNRV